MKEQDIGYLLKQINDRLKISADASLQEIGLTLSQARIMEFLHEKGGQATQKEIEDYLKVAHPTVVGTVSRLEKSGFISCHVDESDRRNKIVCITDKAVEVEAEMLKNREEHERCLLRSLTPKEVAELRRLLWILYQNIE